jgi:hypothetical protein
LSDQVLPDIVRPVGETRGAACPVCGSRRSSAAEEAPGWGEWRACAECTLEFAEPLELPESPQELYGAAYRGEREGNAMREFNERLAQRRAIVDVDPTLWFWSPAFYDIVASLKERLEPGDTVFEVGCGLGFFLHTLRSEGFDAVGLDVAEPAVELNRRDGFEVWHGEVASVPEGWVEPKAIVCMFMLHHLVDPIGVLSTLRSRWPDASLAIAQYGPSNRTPPASLPPRTLTRWSGRALDTALTRSGYRGTVTELAGTGNESRFLRPVRKLVKRSVRVPVVYRSLRRVEHRIVSKVVGPLGRDAYVVLGLAEPVGAATEHDAAGSRA